MSQLKLQVLLARNRKQGSYYAVKMLQKKVIIQRKEVTDLSVIQSIKELIIDLLTVSIIHVFFAAK